MNEDDGLLELSDVLARLGREMKTASETPDPTIGWMNAELEVESVVERGADGTLRFYVVSGGGKVTDRRTVRVKVSLAPYDENMAPAGM